MQHRIGWILTTALIVGCNAQSPADKAGTPPASASTTAANAAAPTIGIDLAGIDKAVKPGDDFEEYANGAWRKKTEIPADRASIGTGFYVYELSEKRTRDLIQTAGKGNPAAGTDERKIADYYAAYMDEPTIEKRGLQAIDADLKAIDAIADTKALSRALGAQVRADTDPLNATNFDTEHLFGVFVSQPLDKAGTQVPYLLQGGLGMPNREFYLSPDLKAKRDAYLAYIEKILTASGTPDAKAKARALDAGITFIDTADFYSAGESEEIVGKALSGGRRENVVLASKVGLPFGEDPNRRGTSRRWITQAVEGSLRRLRTDWIDLYQVHRLDPAVDIDETLGALSDLVQAGKVRMIGASTVAGAEIVEARWAAERRGRERFRTEQPPYSILARAIEYDVLPTCLRHGLGVLTYSPLAGGWLSGGYRKGQQISGPGSPARRQRFAAAYDAGAPANAAKLDAADALAALADDAGITLIQMAIAFVVRHPAVSSAIIGPRTPEHLEPYLAAADVHLSDDVLDRIDEIVAPGHSVNVADNMWNTSMTALDPGFRRRP